MSRKEKRSGKRKKRSKRLKNAKKPKSVDHLDKERGFELQLDMAIRRKYKHLELAAASCCEIGRLFQEHEIYDKAFLEYSDGISLFPNGCLGYECRASLNFHLGKFSEALEDYTKLLELDSKNSQYYYDRAKCHASMNNHKDAIMDATMIIKLQPSDPVFASNVFAFRGAMFEQLNHLEEAERDFNRALTLNPSLSGEKSRKSRNDRKSKKESPKIMVVKKKKKKKKRTPKHSPHRPIKIPVVSNLPPHLITPPPAAVDSSEPTNISNLENHPNNRSDVSEEPNLTNSEEMELKNRGKDLMDNKEFEQSLHIYMKLLRSRPETAEYYFCRGNAFLGLGNYCSAYADFSDALKYSTLVEEPHLTKFKSCVLYNRGIAAIRERMFEEARDDFVEYRKLDLGEKENAEVENMIAKVTLLIAKDTERRIIEEEHKQSVLSNLAE